MKIQEVILEFSPTTGAALGKFLQQTATDISGMLQNLSIQNVDPAVDKVYDDFIKGLRAAIKKDPTTKQNIDKYFNEFTRTTFGLTSTLGKKKLTPALQRVDTRQLVKNGKINTPYIKKVFRDTLLDLAPKDKSVAVGSKPRVRATAIGQ